MTVDISTPIETIEGIGPATAAKLVEAEIHTVFDLLRAPPSAIHAAVRSVASLQQVQSWCAMASLLLVEGMTAQWAEALFKGGVNSLSELSRTNPNELAQVFTNAKNEGVIPDVPQAGTHWAFIQDATALSFTGLLLGTVLDPDGMPVADATAQLGYVEGTTNAQGRFLLARLRLGSRIPLVITHPSHRTLIVEAPPVATRHGVAGQSVFTVKRVSAVAPNTEQLLSELHGDAVPVPNGIPMRESTHDESELEDGDILIVHLVYERTPAAKLVSRFKRYKNGEFLVKSFRVPLARLPNGIELRQTFLFRDGVFRSFPSDAEALRQEIAKRAVRKRFAGARLNLDEDERGAAISERLDAMAEVGLLRGRL